MERKKEKLLKLGDIWLKKCDCHSCPILDYLYSKEGLKFKSIKLEKDTP